ncbi:class I SAM-dependent methyltransferase [Corallococcus sicarius]|uniref:Class I SAM-dependent methyltransferase n=1 Tax=Corallococcus sicarius TaxID=2316726 RepID=A0A3A8MN15_9BACT|nr:class I SAM-dependent methyltransferase [Corallococcus sicarius]
MTQAPTEVELLSSPRATEPFPDAWYDQSSAEHFWFSWRLRALLRLLKDVRTPTTQPLRVLDVGSGPGILAAQLEAATAWTVDAADLNLGALQRCAPRRGRTLYYDVTEERPELAGRYDAVFVFDVIEHLPEPLPLLRSALAHLKPGGLFLINVPALQACFSQYDVEVGHLRRYTTASLEEALEPLGLQSVALRYWGLSLLPALVARRATMPVGRLQERIVERGLVPPSKWVDGALRALMHAETRLASRPVLGTSVLYAGRVP